MAIQKILGVALIAMLLSGCVSSPYTYNEGSTRVKVFDRTKSESQGIYISPTNDADASKIIHSGQAFSIRLVNAFICDFREGVIHPKNSVAPTNRDAVPCPGGDGNQYAATRGEVAIVANVGERKNGTGLSFNPSKIQNGRVVYYNEDVRETGQLINALNLPIYGPKTYEGNPVFMDFSVLELDNKENAAARKLLAQLAQIGSLPAAPNTAVLNLLNSLGGALIDANSNDMEMRYQLEMDSELNCNEPGAKKPFDCKDVAVHRMPLREGYYAFIRNENRSETPSLNGVMVCEDQGVLCKLGEAASDYEPWHEKSWLLVRVARENDIAALDQDDAEDLATLMSALDADAGVLQGKAISDVTEAVNAVLTERANKLKARQKKREELQALGSNGKDKPGTPP